MNYELLSKQVSYILRHNPHCYNLQVDINGWVDLASLLEHLGSDQRFAGISVNDVVEMINKSRKKRHEIRGGKIRAIY
jgi:putative RNA 2'-phosphotransferase